MFNTKDVLTRIDKGNSFIARIEGEKYLIYYKQYSPDDGSELVGQEQVRLVTLAEVDTHIEQLQAQLDAAREFREALTGTSVTAEQINARSAK